MISCFRKYCTISFRSPLGKEFSVTNAFTCCTFSSAARFMALEFCTIWLTEPMMIEKISPPRIMPRMAKTRSAWVLALMSP